MALAAASALTGANFPPVSSAGGASANGSSYHRPAGMAGSAIRSSSSAMMAGSGSPALPSGASGRSSAHHHSRSTANAASTSMGSQFANGSGIDSPVAANSIANRTANAAYGLYQNCLSLRRQLRRIPGFEDYFSRDAASMADAASEYARAAASSSSNNDATSPLSPTGTGPPAIDASAAIANDPVSQLCRIFRLGSSLCYIWNALGQGKALEVNPDASPTNFKACQRAAAHFIMACNTQLGWSDDDIFRITELYSPDTNGTVKVVHTVAKFVRLLDERGLLLPDDEEAPVASTSSGAGLDPRSRVVKEILDSERKYVQDLEVLQDYQKKLAEDGILSQDTIHNLFLNLNTIVDFARKFLIGVEANASLAPEQQRFGSLFLSMEQAFSVYEPYCVNFLAASDLAVGLAKQENSPLSRVSHILDPAELAMFHIKPVQRLLKYHLLFENLVKASDADWPHHEELKEGMACAKRIADKVNEETRKQENKQAVEDLRGRVEDWKGHELASFGELLLQDTFQVLKSDVERDYQVYLFQKIILCCKEAPPTGKNKPNKSNSMIRKSGTGQPPAANGKKAQKPNLQLKGRIFINNISSLEKIVKPAYYLLNIHWRGDSTDEAFGIRCRTPEQLAQWTKAVQKCVDEVAAQRRSRSQGQLYRRIASPHSQFPNTPQFEAPPLGPMSMHPTHSDGHLSLHSNSSYINGHHGQGPYGGGNFDDEGDEGYVGDYEPSTGRSTPSLVSDRSSAGPLGRRGNTTHSMPAGMRQDQRERDLQQAMGSGRPRAQTEDSNSAVIHQWRSQTPNGGYAPVPPLPRQVSSSSSHSNQDSQNGEGRSLRHSASKGTLRHKQSHEWGNPPPVPSSSGSSTVAGSPAMTMTSLRGQSLPQAMEEIGLSVSGEPLRMLRQNSQGNMPPYPNSGASMSAPPLRSRSASSPNVYQLTPGQVANLSNQGSGGHDAQWSPYPMENVHPSHLVGQRQQPNGSSSNQNLPFNRKAPANQSTATIASTAGSSTTIPPKRFSSSSTSTDRSSGDSSQSQGLPYHSPTSPVSAGGTTLSGRSRENGASTPQPPSSQREPPMSPSSAVKLRVTYGVDTFVVVALSSISYRELAEKVVRKIQLCGARNNGLDASTLKLRYEDEDGDKIVMKADDDVAMAFDWLRSGGGGAGNALTLYAE